MNANDSQAVRWTGGRVAALVSGIVIAFIGLALVVGGIGLLIVHGATRDDDGYYTTGTERLATAAHALTVEDIDNWGGDAVSSVPEDLLGRVRVRAERPAGQPVFVGIAHDDDLDAYLQGVRRAEVTDLDPPEYDLHSGGAPRLLPGAETFWVASAEGRGRQAADWDVEGGHWSVVAMNADGPAGSSWTPTWEPRWAGSWAPGSARCWAACCSAAAALCSSRLRPAAAVRASGVDRRAVTSAFGAPRG